MVKDYFDLEIEKQNKGRNKSKKTFLIFIIIIGGFSIGYNLGWYLINIFKMDDSSKIIIVDTNETTTTTDVSLTTISTTTILPTTTIILPITTSSTQNIVVKTDINWLLIADCESGKRLRDGTPIPGTADWFINTGNGYYGGLQFSHETWISSGGGRFSENAHLTTRENQIVIASGISLTNWPNCRRYAYVE